MPGCAANPRLRPAAPVPMRSWASGVRGCRGRASSNGSRHPACLTELAGSLVGGVFPPVIPLRAASVSREEPVLYKKTEVRSQKSEGNHRHYGGRAQGLMALCIVLKVQARRKLTEGIPLGTTSGARNHLSSDLTAAIIHDELRQGMNALFGIRVLFRPRKWPQ